MTQRSQRTQRLSRLIKATVSRQLSVQPYVMRRPGKVTTYNSGDTPKTVDITLAGSTVVIPDVRFLDTYTTPATNDQVEVMVWGVGESLDMIVLGKLRG